MCAYPFNILNDFKLVTYVLLGNNESEMNGIHMTDTCLTYEKPTILHIIFF